jgi:hypothetical protein
MLLLQRSYIGNYMKHAVDGSFGTWQMECHLCMAKRCGGGMFAVFCEGFRSENFEKADKVRMNLSLERGKGMVVMVFILFGLL